MFGLDESLTINLQTYFPFTPGDEKFVAILARGNTEIVQQERSFDTSNDPETEQIVQIAAPQTGRTGGRVHRTAGDIRPATGAAPTWPTPTAQSVSSA